MSLMFGFQIIGIWGIWRVERCLFEMDGGDQEYVRNELACVRDVML